MEDSKKASRERSVLQWGGIAGVLGGVLFIAVFAIVGFGPVGIEPVEPVREVMRFPEIRTARIVENGLYLAVLVLWAVHFLALYRALRPTSLAPALFGSFVGILGLAMLAAGALPHVATDPISDLYHAPGATPEDRAALVLMWQATMGILEMLLATGLLLVPAGVVALGAAMFGAPAFGKAFGTASVALGTVGLAAGVAFMVDIDSPATIPGVFALIFFHLVVGWKVHGLSRGLADGHGGADFERRSVRAPEAPRMAESAEEAK